MSPATSQVYYFQNQHRGTSQMPFAGRLPGSKLDRKVSNFSKAVCKLLASHHWTKLLQRQNHLSGWKALAAHCNFIGLLLHSCKAKLPNLLYLISHSLALASPPNEPQDHCQCRPQDFKWFESRQSSQTFLTTFLCFLSSFSVSAGLYNTHNLVPNCSQNPLIWTPRCCDRSAIWQSCRLICSHSLRISRLP